jgi:hypothetical protein
MVWTHPLELSMKGTYAPLHLEVAPVFWMRPLINVSHLFSENDGFDVAPYRKIGDYPHPTRGEQGHQVIEDDIRER